MKIMILGSTGTVGTAMELACLEKGIDYVAYSHNDIDITEDMALRVLVENVKPDVIVNCVAIVGINQCAKDKDKAHKINSESVGKLCAIAKDNEAILVQPSTHTVFKGDYKGYYTEEFKPNPQNTYGDTKYLSEIIVANRLDKYYIVRFPTLFGPRWNNSLGFVDKVIKWIEDGKDLKIADDKLDSPTYTLDAAREILDILEDREPYGIYHIANEGGVSLYGFVEELMKQMNVPNKLERAKDSDFTSMEPKAVNTMMKSIKRKPMRDWKEALREYLNEYII